MSKIRNIFSYALVAMRIAGFIATIALHGNDILNIVCTHINLVHVTLHATADRS